MIAVVGEDAPAGTTFTKTEPYSLHVLGLGPDKEVVPCQPGEYVNDMVQLELVYVEKTTGRMVGDEANDYKCKDGEVAAVKIS